MREFQLCLGNWYLVSRNAGNNVSECSFLNWFPGGACPQTPQGSLRARKAPCDAKKMSRPVFSRICPLLCKAVEIPDACDFGRRFQGFLSTFNKHRHFSLWFLCFNDSGLGKSFDWFMLNFVIREIWLKLCVTLEFCYNLCMKRDHDPPPLLCHPRIYDRKVHDAIG